MRPALLLVGLDPVTRAALRDAFLGEYEVHDADDARTALSLLKKHPISFAFIEVRLPDGSGLDLLRQIKRFDVGIDVMMAAADRDVETALSAMKLGAYDFLNKPVRTEALKALLSRLREHRQLLRENQFLKEEMEGSGKAGIYPGSSPASQHLARRIAEAVGGSGPVLIQGEAGTEREAVAREIHRKTPGGHRPFIVLCCQGRGRESLEGDLFGRRESVRGRGAPHPGKLEFAEGGFLFLEHADLMPPELQGRLLHACQTPSGPSLPVRILASCATGTSSPSRWNEEWRAHLSRLVIQIPPLRERRKDIPGLIERHLKRVCALSRTPVKGLTREAEQFLTHYAWPGNVMELENTVEIMSLMAERDVLGLEDLPLDILIQQGEGSRGRAEARLSLKKARRHFERQYIRKVLEQTRGNQTRAAETLGLHRNTLIWKLRELQMRDDYRDILEKRRGRVPHGKALSADRRTP